MHAHRRTRAVPERGFALLEVLVAFMIAALALGGLVAAALDGLRATATTAQPAALSSGGSLLDADQTPNEVKIARRSTRR